MTNAYIDELFSSIQGEGPWIGQRHIFVRFLGCDLRCSYCDTPAAAVALTAGEKTKRCRLQKRRDSFEFEEAVNPLTGARLTELCTRLSIPGPSRPTLCLTGGEPLLREDFDRVYLAARRAGW